MPAVELSRLKTQIQLLSQHYASAPDFVKRLCGLYEFYADRTFTQSDAGRRSLPLPAYSIPEVINRQFELEFGKLCQANPLSSLDVVDGLWKQPYQEPKRLAVSMLGKIPVEYSDQVIQRIQAWSTPEESHEMVEYLHDAGSKTLRQKATEKWLCVIQNWLESKESQKQIFGLQSLLALINDQDFINLPRIFDLLFPLLAEPQVRVMYMLQNTISALAKRSAIETTFVLKTALSQKHSPDLPRLVRRLLPVFPEDQQKSLKLALNEEKSSLTK